jgi:DNA polymerase-3 subunit chi
MMPGMRRLTVEFVNLAKLGLPRETAAARLAAFHYSQGRRVLIKTADPLAAERLDRELWTFEQDSFIPHDLAGGADEASEPVLISTGTANLNRAPVLIMLDPVEYNQVKEFNHLIYFVPAKEGPELHESRERYKALKTRAEVKLIHSTALPA